jgi:FAD/FMN-containing dehydrogenase
LNNSYLSLLQSGLTPAAIVLPRTRIDVCKFVDVIRPRILSGAARLVVRGAGQQPVPGCSNIDNPSVTIDLRYLTSIEIKDEVVSIGAGER